MFLYCYQKCRLCKSQNVFSFKILPKSAAIPWFTLQLGSCPNLEGGVLNSSPHSIILSRWLMSLAFFWIWFTMDSNFEMAWNMCVLKYNIGTGFLTSTLWMTNNSKYDDQPWPTFTAAAAATANDPFSFTNEGHLTKVIMVTWHTRRVLLYTLLQGSLSGKTAQIWSCLKQEKTMLQGEGTYW